MAAQVERPADLAYEPDFLSEAEEQELLSAIETEVDFRDVVMRGQTARRTVRHFGFDYGYESWQLVPGDPLPPWIGWLRDRCAGLGGREPGELAQALITRYPAGAGIGWHRDAPVFGAPVVGVSLLSACRMRFQRTADGERRVYEVELAPRSAYVLDGAARWAWQHSIPATNALRYSITFRTIRKRS